MIENLLKDLNATLESPYLEEAYNKALSDVNPFYLTDEYLEEIFNECNIIAKYDVREDISYYNESEPDIEKLKQAKVEGEKLRTKNDLFYLSLAIAIKENEITLEDAKRVLNDTFEELSFDNLIDIKFVGDGTYLKFTDKYIEIRPSGTDAKTKAYGGGEDLNSISDFAKILGNYSGDRTELHRKLISEDFYEKAKDIALDYYLKFVDKDADTSIFEIPEYNY